MEIVILALAAFLILAGILGLIAGPDDVYYRMKNTPRTPKPNIAPKPQKPAYRKRK